VKLYVSKVLEALDELADVREQRRLWLASSGEVSSLVEVCCGLFDDSGLGDAMNKGSVFGADVDGSLHQLRRRLQQIVRTHAQSPATAILDDPEMVTVRSLAQEIASAVRTSSARASPSGGSAAP
jgi:hypothetical protein